MKYILGAVMILLYGGITFYLGYNFRALLHSFQINPKPILYWIVVFILSFSFILGRLHPTLSFLSVIGNYWMFVVEYGLILCILSNVLIKFTPLTTKAVGSGAFIVFVILFAVGTYCAYSPVVHKETIKIDKKGEDMTVVLASDFHLGVLSGKTHLERFVKLSNEANPDLVLLAGDIIDDDPTVYQKKNMKETMAQLKSTYGVYGILGNHEYYGKKIPEFIDEMEQSNVTILRDETIELPNGVMLTGREDITNTKREPLSALVPKNAEAPWIVMNHTPNDLSEPQLEKVDLHVSGHTHRGQLWPNQLLTKRIFDLDYGYEIRQPMHAIVSSGFGFWGPPMRIGSRAELWVIEIKYN